MTNEESNEILAQPEKVEISQILIDNLLGLQASFNANMVDKYNTEAQKEALKMVIKVIDRKIEEIDPLFFESIKQAVD